MLIGQDQQKIRKILQVIVSFEQTQCMYLNLLNENSAVSWKCKKRSTATEPAAKLNVLQF